MKKIYFLIFILLYASTDILALNDISQLNQQNLTISGNTIQYSDFDNILLPNGLSLPYQTIYFPLEEFSDISTLYAQNIEFEKITTFQDLQSKDIPTSSDQSLYADVISSVAFDNLGFNQIQVMEKINISNKEYLKCMNFPVTIDSFGQAYFHTKSEFLIGEKIITDTQFLSESQISELQKDKKEVFNRALSLSTQYVIITNQELSLSFEQLMKYKNETGISTEIKLIENILSQYNGRDDAEKLREYLKEFYANGGQFVLLGGDETVLPIRYAYHNIAYTLIDLENQQICDLYFADLTGDWNADNDSVWGEKYTDSVDLIPELYVGRLPFNQPYEVSQYIDKLIQYETNKKQIDLSYLEKSFFFSSDQMRDYGTIGQHGLIAQAYPEYFIIDTINGVEYSTGNDLNPTNPTSKELEPILSEGFGIVNIIAHGSSMTFEVRTSNYNDWPKSFFTTDTGLTGSGIVSNLEANNNVSFYISLGCDNGAFDKDLPPFNHLNPNLVQTLLAQENSGAVGFVANTRWGWVSTSHLLQKRFIEYLFENDSLPAIVSFYEMKNDFYYYRDLIYGINYFGDPTMVMYTKKPKPINLAIENNQSNLFVTSYSNGTALENSKIYLSEEGDVISEFITDINGQAIINYDFKFGSNYKISAFKNGYTINQKDYQPSIATDIDNGLDIAIPTSYSLDQNYPNPFNPSTIISFALPQKSEINLQVFNMLGQQVKTITTGTYNAGVHNFEWDSKDNYGNLVATGIYLYRLETDEFIDQKKMVLLR